MENSNWTEQNENTIVSRNQTVRSKDLATRQRVNFVLSNSIMAQLRSKSEEEQMPMSRIIEAALIDYYSKATPHISTTSLTPGVSLFHLFEIIIAETTDSEFVRLVFEVLKQFFDNYTYSSCLLKKSQGNSASIGTKIMLYLSDNQNCQFSDFLNEIAKHNNSESIKLFLDGNEIRL